MYQLLGLVSKQASWEPSQFGIKSSRDYFSCSCGEVFRLTDSSHAWLASQNLNSADERTKARGCF